MLAGRFGTAALATAIAIAGCTNSDDDSARRDSPAVRDSAFSSTDLTAALSAAGSRPTSVENVSDITFPNAKAFRWCVDGTQVSVYEYPTKRDRTSVSKSIDPLGSPVGNAYIDWVGPPRFYARGRLLALVVTDEPTINATLAQALGPPLTSKADFARFAQRSTACGPGSGTAASPT